MEAMNNEEIVVDTLTMTVSLEANKTEPVKAKSYSAHYCE